MSKNYSIQDAQNLIKLELDARRKAISFTPAIVEVLNKFNGKQLNKRLDTALKQIDKSLYFRSEHNSFVIDWYVDDRSVKAREGEHTNYIDYHSITLCHCSIQASDGTGAAQDGTLNAEVAIEWLNKFVSSMQKTITETEEQFKNVEQYKQRRRELKQAIEDFNNNIPHMLDRYFDLRIDMKMY